MITPGSLQRGPKFLHPQYPTMGNFTLKYKKNFKKKRKPQANSYFVSFCPIVRGCRDFNIYSSSVPFNCICCYVTIQSVSVIIPYLMSTPTPDHSCSVPTHRRNPDIVSFKRTVKTLHTSSPTFTHKLSYVNIRNFILFW